MSNPGKGGRGKLAPYKTIHYRIPEPIKKTVESLANAYRIFAGSRNWEGANKLLDEVNNAILVSTNFDKNEVINYNEKIANLEKQVTDFKAEREKQLSILVPALEYKPQQARKVQEAIREAFPELKVDFK